MKRISRAGLLVTASAIGLSLAIPMSGAHADVAAGSGDIVGVGSDTAQYGLDFLADGDIGGDAGFNATSAAHRIVNFDASGDASGSATTGVTSVLRAGSKPVTRPNGSGGGITALNADTGTTHVINYVRSSRLPSQAEQNTAVANGWGGLRVIQFATDSLQIATAATTNAPAGLSIDELANIYDGTWTTWSQVPGYSGPNGAHAIIATIPQSGSGTRNFFTADLQAAFTAAGGTGTFTFAPSVVTVQEHDPKGITSQSSPADAIGAFSVGRVSLINGGYFGPSVQNSIKLLTAAAPDAAASYNVSRGLYILIRESDIASTTPFLAGGTKNWANTLFVTSTSQIAKNSSKPNIQAAGLTPAYSDLADAHS